MTPKKASPEASVGDTVADQLRQCSEHEVFSSRWRSVDRSSNAPARCRSAHPHKGGCGRLRADSHSSVASGGRRPFAAFRRWWFPTRFHRISHIEVTRVEAGAVLRVNGTLPRR